MGYHIVWAYGSLCMAIFLVRTMKRVIFQEARHYSEFHWGTPLLLTSSWTSR